MIELFPAGITDLVSDGIALFPEKCEVTEKAGAEYELEMEHPIDNDGRWKWLHNNALIRCSVPLQTVPAIDAIHEDGYSEYNGGQVWKVKSSVSEASIYSQPRTSSSVKVTPPPSDPTTPSYTNTSEPSGIKVVDGSFQYLGDGDLLLVQLFDSSKGQTAADAKLTGATSTISQISESARDYLTEKFGTIFEGVRAKIDTGFGNKDGIAIFDLADGGLEKLGLTVAEGKEYESTTEAATPADTPKTQATPTYRTVATPVVAKLKAGTEFIMYGYYNAKWLVCMTKEGVSGYIQADNAEFVSDGMLPDLDIVGVNGYQIRDQLFRVYSVEIDREAKKVNVNAKHISYDFGGLVTGRCSVNDKPIPRAIGMLQRSLLVSDARLITTNIDRRITAEWSFINPINALLDPDNGMVPLLHAKIIRDNYNFYILTYDEAISDRGYRIAYGRNMKGVTWKRSTDDLVTRVLPIAQDEGGNNMLLPELFILPDESTIPVGAPERVEILNVNVKVGDKKDPNDEASTTYTVEEVYQLMREKARERFDVDQMNLEKVELEVDFVHLGDTYEFRQYKELEKLYLYDKVTIEDENIGLNVKIAVIETVWDAILNRYVSIKLGDPFDDDARNSIASYQIRALDGSKVNTGTVTAGKLKNEAVTGAKISSNISVTPGTQNEIKMKNTDTNREYTLSVRGSDTANPTLLLKDTYGGSWTIQFTTT